MKHLFLAASLALAPAAATCCDLALALAVDISGSVDTQEFEVQMVGLAEALRDSIVSEALVRAEAAVMLVQWTGSSRQELTIPWTRTRSFADVEVLADQIASAPRRWRNFSTAIGDAMEFVVGHWDSAPDCKRKVIDISGDGLSNEGIDPKAMRATYKALGITVNALAIEESESDLTTYFWTDVIYGEGAFVETAATFAEYPDRIRQKLIRETTAQISCQSCDALHSILPVSYID